MPTSSEQTSEKPPAFFRLRFVVTSRRGSLRVSYCGLAIGNQGVNILHAQAGIGLVEADRSEVRSSSAKSMNSWTYFLQGEGGGSLVNLNTRSKTGPMFLVKSAM